MKYPVAFAETFILKKTLGLAIFNSEDLEMTAGSDDPHALFYLRIRNVVLKYQRVSNTLTISVFNFERS